MPTIPLTDLESFYQLLAVLALVLLVFSGYIFGVSFTFKNQIRRKEKENEDLRNG